MITMVEQRGVFANLLAWIVIALGAAALPNGHAFVAPLAFRLLAMLINRWGWNNLRARMARMPDRVPSFMTMHAVLFVGGASWALVILPMLLDPVIHPARLAVGATTMIGVAIIISLLAPIRSLAIAFAAGFLAAFVMGMQFAESGFGFGILLATAGVLLALLAYSFALTRQKVLTAQMIVDNRRLETALEKSLLRAEKLATTDPLTGLPNRRAFFESCAEEQALNAHKSLHLLTLDLDYFKQVNDTFGHEIGDEVLIQTSLQLTELLDTIPGSGHIACRLGGEEFVAALYDLDRSTATSVAEALRKRIARIFLPQATAGDGDGQSLSISASIGIAKLARDETIDDLLRRSDLAMYRAKDRGRNRVEQAA